MVNNQWSIVDTAFLNKYFIDPIYLDEGYNLVNTVTYALIAIVALFLIYKALEKINFVVDKRFFYAIFPFILFGSSLRAFVDAGFYGISFWTVAPGIYILTAAIFLAVFFISLATERFSGGKIAYWRLSAGVGTIALLVHVSLVVRKLQIANGLYGIAIICIASAITIALFFFFRFYKFEAGKKYFWPFPAHMLDAASTFIAVDFLGATEKHPLPIFATNLLGTAAVMFVLKLLVLIPLVYLLDKEFADKNFARYLAIAAAVLGFAEGIRNLLVVLTI